jgi:hypothetical protein
MREGEDLAETTAREAAIAEEAARAVEVATAEVEETETSLPT